MDNKKIIEYLESKGLNISLETPKIYLKELEITKKNIESAKKDVLDQVVSFFDDDRNYIMFKKDFENFYVDFTDIVHKIENIVNEYLEQQVKSGWREMLEEFFVITKEDAERNEYKALNMEKIGNDNELSNLEEKFNFIKNMNKEEILEFMHYENYYDDNDTSAFFPNEILEHMNPEYLKDDEFVEKILGAYIVEYPYDDWRGNEYYNFSESEEYPFKNKNYNAFFNRLTSEQQIKFSPIVGKVEPALATNLKDTPPYFIAEYLRGNDRFEEILKYIEDEEDIARKETLESYMKSYIEELMDEIEFREEDEEIEEVISSGQLKFLSKLYTTEYGRDIIDDEKWSQILKENKDLLDERMQKEVELKKLQEEDKQCDETLAKAEQLEQIQENGNKTVVDD